MLWGGRFKEGLSEDAMEFSTSFIFDKRLMKEDLRLSKAQASMLAKQGLISTEESKEIIGGLNEIQAQWTSGHWNPNDCDFEDVHSAIETKLKELIGPTAGKLHTGRSRNDQIATTMRIWTKGACRELEKRISAVQKAMLGTAKNHTETIIPGYTHMQRAQPVSLAFHLLAYVEMLERDKARVGFTLRESDSSPLGSGALAGSTLPLDRNYTAEKLQFNSICGNAMDAVSDRDFLLDFLNSCLIGMMHLSRLSEELVLWSSAEWKFLRLPDSLTTGSSLMPQKKNPDMAELIRGKSGRVYGNYISLATTMKGLPLSYNRDLQEDKEPVFDSYDTWLKSLSIMEDMISSLEVMPERFSEELKKDFCLSTDLADYLVLKGIPFRESHGIVGRLVQYAEDRGIGFDKLSLEDLKRISPAFDQDALQCLSIEGCLDRKKTLGSPNPALIKEQIASWESRLITSS